MDKELFLEGSGGEEFEKIQQISNTNIFACYQCGNCSAGCPSADYMDILPHAVIRLIQLGRIEEALGANTSWICAACITCSVRCPKGVDIAAVMEALRQLVLRQDVQKIRINQIDKALLSELPQIALVNNFRKLTL